MQGGTGWRSVPNLKPCQSRHPEHSRQQSLKFTDDSQFTHSAEDLAGPSGASSFGAVKSLAFPLMAHARVTFVSGFCDCIYQLTPHSIHQGC